MTTTSATEVVEQAPTFDLAYERVVLGAMMLSTDAVLAVADHLAEPDFYNPRHGEIFTAILDQHRAEQPTAALAMTAKFTDAGSITRLGGAEFLHQCIAEVPSASQVGHYANRVVELAERRAWQAKGIRITQAASTSVRSADEIAALAAELLTPTRRGGSEMTRLGDVMRPGLEVIISRKTMPAGLSTGIPDLDRMLGGLRKKQLITIAAPTGAGKSIFLTDLARELAIHQNLPVAFFTLEMDNSEVFERILAAETGLLFEKVRDGDITDQEWGKAAKKIAPMATAPLFMSDDAEITVNQIKTRCQITAQRHGLAAVIVDYMQIVTPSRRVSSEQEGVSDVSKSLKRLAGTLDVPLIAAAQMNKGPDLRADKLPQLTDLRGSGSIANDSNVVLFVHRPDYYDPESIRSGEADLVVRKARSGRKGHVTVAAQLDRSRFRDFNRDYGDNDN